MTEEIKKMKPIWYFVGLLLIITGVLIVISGIYYIFNPGSANTVLADTYPNLWWGSLMLVTGLIFFFKTRKETID